jgi:hypothetical protein
MLQRLHVEGQPRLRGVADVWQHEHGYFLHGIDDESAAGPFMTRSHAEAAVARKAVVR